jgi:hypothetical protein
MFRNVASQKLTVFAWDSTTGLPKTGDAANLTAYVSKDDGSVTALTDTSATEQSSSNAPGYYVFDLTQSETNADKLMFSAVSSTSNIAVLAVPSVVYTTPANWTKTVIDSSGLVDANTVKVGPSGSGTAQTAKDLGALDVTNLNTLASHDPGETIMGTTDLGTGSGLTSLASASNLATAKTAIDGIKTVTDALPDNGALSSLAQGSALAVVGNTAGAIKDVTDELPDAGALTSLATAAALTTLQGNMTTLLARVIALAVTTGSVGSGTASATAFPTDLTETADDHWNDAFLVFTSGDLAGQVKRITDYDGTGKTITVSGGFTAAPDEGDDFAIVNR